MKVLKSVTRLGLVHIWSLLFQKKFIIYSFSFLVMLFLGCKSSTKITSADTEKIDVDFCLKYGDLDQHKPQLLPFKYGGNQYLDVLIKPYEQILRNYIELKYNSDYRLIFSKTGLPSALANAPIRIFDKDFTDPKQKLLFESTEKVFVFDYKKEIGASRIYVEYFIPSKETSYVNYVDKRGVTHDDIKQESVEFGCIGFIYGYINVP